MSKGFNEVIVLEVLIDKLKDGMLVQLGPKLVLQTSPVFGEAVKTKSWMCDGIQNGNIGVLSPLTKVIGKNARGLNGYREELTQQFQQARKSVRRVASTLGNCMAVCVFSFR